MENYTVLQPKKYNSERELGKLFFELKKKLYGEYASINLSSLAFQYNFAIIPKGSGHGTVDRSKNSIFNKQSVLKIVNDDNNCFWYALACLMYPENKSIRDSRNPQARQKVAGDICKKCKLVWNQPTPLISIPFVEDAYDCNIYVVRFE
jgi:hypothetical protein